MAQNESVFSSTCVLCGKKMGFFNGKIILKDGYVCNDCWDKKGLKKRIDYMTESRNYSASQIRDIVNSVNNDTTASSAFRGNTLTADLIQCDDSTQIVQIISKVGFNSAKDYLRYDQIIDFELIEDGETITKGGLGTTVAGGIIGGMGGAIVGSVVGKKKTKPICTSLQIRISAKDFYKKAIFVKYIETPTKCDSFTYKQMIEQARKAIAELQVAVSFVATQPTTTKDKSSLSIADEIAKLKSLLEQGIITEDEFIEAKQKLLYGGFVSGNQQG